MVSVITIKHLLFYLILIIYLQSGKWLQILLFNTHYSIQHHSFVYTQLIGSKCCCMSLTIWLNISSLFTQLNDQTLLFLTIQISMKFPCKQFKYQIIIFDPSIGPYQVLVLWATVGQVEMALKRHSMFSKSPRLEPHHQIVRCHIQETRWGSLTPLQRLSRCILRLWRPEETCYPLDACES